MGLCWRTREPFAPEDKWLRRENNGYRRSRPDDDDDDDRGQITSTPMQHKTAPSKLAACPIVSTFRHVVCRLCVVSVNDSKKNLIITTATAFGPGADLLKPTAMSANS